MNRVPFDTETYTGFYIELFLQMFTAHFYMLIVSSTVSIFHAFCIFIDGLIKDYSLAFENFDKQYDEERLRKLKQRNGDKSINIQLETRRFLKHAIDLHVGILKWVLCYVRNEF